MKSKKGKILLPALGVALCAIMLIGTAYAAAAVTYTGTTSNNQNSVNSAYITLSGDDYAESFSKEILYNSVNDRGTITYEPIGASPITVNEVSIAKAVLIGKLILTIDQAENDKDRFTLKINEDGNSTVTANKFYIGCEITTDSVKNNEVFRKYVKDDTSFEAGPNTTEIVVT